MTNLNHAERSWIKSMRHFNDFSFGLLEEEISQRLKTHGFPDDACYNSVNGKNRYNLLGSVLIGVDNGEDVLYEQIMFT